MIRFNLENYKECVIRFRHNTPSIEVPNIRIEGNCLSSLLDSFANSMKLNQGLTECILQLDVVDGYPLVSFTGYAHTHPTDVYRKENGRELAVKRAARIAVEEEILTETQYRQVLSAYYGR